MTSPASPDAPIDQQSRCPRCHGSTAVYSPYWRAFLDRHRHAQHAWRQTHPDGDWWAAPEYREVERYTPPTHEPEERPCRTCDEHGVGDLISSGITDAADAAGRAARHLAEWRSSQGGDLSAGRDALEALRAAANAAFDAAERLRDELADAELTERLRTDGLPLAEDYPPSEDH